MKTCFVIMPFENKLNTYYSKLIKPTVEKMKYIVKRADEIYSIRPIIDDIISEIEKADIIIADVTNKNPNVNYELGYAHALKKNVIIISQTIDDIPFDYRHKRTIIYNVADVDWQDKLKKSIKETIEVLDEPDIIIDKIKKCSTSELRSFLEDITTEQIYNFMITNPIMELYATYADGTECCINVQAGVGFMKSSDIVIFSCAVGVLQIGSFCFIIIFCYRNISLRFFRNFSLNSSPKRIGDFILRKVGNEMRAFSAYGERYGVFTHSFTKKHVDCCRHIHTKSAEQILCTFF